jgi:hypothetical protein
MTLLSQSSESSKCQSNFNNSSDSTSFDHGQRKKIKLDDKLKFYGFDKLHEGYIFGKKIGFEIPIDHIFRPHITTNQHEFDLDNANKLFNLMKHDGAIFSLLVLKPNEIQEENSNQVLYFDKDYTFEETIENSNYVTNGQPTPHFKKRLRSQLVDGQHVVWTCKDAKKKLEKNEISQSIYNSKFANRCANVVFNDEVDKYLVMSSFLNETF